MLYSNDKSICKVDNDLGKDNKWSVAEQFAEADCLRHHWFGQFDQDSNRLIVVVFGAAHSWQKNCQPDDTGGVGRM